MYVLKCFQNPKIWTLLYYQNSNIGETVTREGLDFCWFIFCWLTNWLDCFHCLYFTRPVEHLLTGYLVWLMDHVLWVTYQFRVDIGPNSECYVQHDCAQTDTITDDTRHAYGCIHCRHTLLTYATLTEGKFVFLLQCFRIITSRLKFSCLF